MLASRRPRAIRLPLLSSVATAAVVVAVSACGAADEPPAVSQTVEFTATEYAFSADASTQITAGTTVRLRLTNNGELTHEMQVLDSTTRLVDRIDRVPPGASGEVVVTFEESGAYTLICDIDDHLSRGQRASFIVD